MQTLQVLKDFILKYHMLQGRKVKYVPGWDCHGLPIELKVISPSPHNTRNLISTYNCAQLILHLHSKREFIICALMMVQSRRADICGY